MMADKVWIRLMAYDRDPDQLLHDAIPSYIVERTSYSLPFSNSFYAYYF